MTADTTTQLLEWSAMVLLLASVALAAWRHIATWPVGIVACVLYGALFVRTQLYADATLQAFFVATSIIGWRQWHGAGGLRQPMARPPLRPGDWAWMLGCAGTATLAYGALLAHWTAAYAPFWDSAVMSASVVAQLLLMQGRRETWPCWLLVNTLSVPLYLGRGLHVTAALYALFWLNACWGWWRWRRLDRATTTAVAA